MSFRNQWTLEEWLRYFESYNHARRIRGQVTVEDVTKWMEREICKAILGEEAMEKHNHEEQSCNWPPENYELAKFSYPSSVKGYSHFALHRDCIVSGHRALLMLHPVNPMHGVPVVAQCNREFKWEVTCDYSMVSAVAVAIPRADAFIRNLLEQSERVKLPSEAHWDSIHGAVGAYVSKNGRFYPLPEDELEAGIFDTLAKEFRRTHRP